MDITLGGLAFFGLIAAHFAAVIAVHNARWDVRSPEPQDFPEDARNRYLLNFGG